MQDRTPSAMPVGAWNAHGFQLFNSVSFTLMLGAPMMLYFKHLGATATVLGVLLALNPLLNILQIPAARFVERVGYRAFVVKGWTTRSFFIIAVAGVAWMPVGWLTNNTRMLVVLLLLAAFNAARGISVCGYLPWMTQWIPEDVRGRFLSRDQMAIALASAGTALATAVYLGQAQPGHRFAILFVVSYLAALVSLMFLRRIPDVPVLAENKSSGPIPWKAMLWHPPFLKFMIFDVVTLAGIAGASVLWIPLLRDVYEMGDEWILGMATVTGIAIVMTLLVFGRLADRVGSRPLLGLAGGVFVIHFLSWAAVGAQWLGMDWLMAGWLSVSAGICFGLFNLANTRLAMATVPEMGRSHFLALFSVITNLTLGIFPVFWGWAADQLIGWRLRWGDWEWNRFSLLYVGIIVFILLGQLCRRRVVELRSMDTDTFVYELLVKTPARALSRLLPRRPMP